MPATANPARELSSPAELPPRVAVLVLAYQAPSVLEQLTRLLNGDRFTVFVHLDGKACIDAYRGNRAWPGNVHFITERLEVYWGGYNMVRATVSLVEHALCDASHHVVALVSDDTLPWLPPGRLHAELLAKPNRIDLGMAWRNPPFLKRYEEYFHFDADATAARPMEVHRRAVSERALAALQRLDQLRRRGKYPLDRLWSGSQWWSFSRSMLGHMLADLHGNPWLRESFEFSAVPDEMVFHTLYARRMGLKWRSVTGPMHTDFSRDPAPFVFTAAEQIADVPDGRLFVRKVADGAAAQVAEGLARSWDARDE